MDISADLATLNSWLTEQARMPVGTVADQWTINQYDQATVFAPKKIIEYLFLVLEGQVVEFSPAHRHASDAYAELLRLCAPPIREPQ